MKRVTAWFLTLSLVLLCVFPVHASVADGNAGGMEKGLQTAVSGSGDQIQGNDNPDVREESGSVSSSSEKDPENDGAAQDSAQDKGQADSGTGQDVDHQEDPDSDLKEDPDSDLKEDPDSDSKEDPDSDSKEDPDSDSKEDPDSDLEEDPDGDPEEDPDGAGGEDSADVSGTEPSPGPGSVSPLPGTGADGAGPLEDPEKGETGAGAVPVAAELEESEDWNKENAPSDAKGGIKVILMNAIPADKIQFNVSLEQDGQAVGTARVITLENDSVKHSESFEGLSTGTYCLKITAPGFLEYKQDIEVNRNIRTAEIYTGFVELEALSSDGDFSYEGEVHPGVILIGDANRDGVLDEKDGEAIMSAMSRGQDGVLIGDPDQNPTDLDRDGKTSLVDLQYYVNSRAKQQNPRMDTTAFLCSDIVPEAVKVNLSPGTEVAEGSPEDILKDKDDDKVVVLKNKDGEDISEDNPVEFGFNLQSREQEELKEGVPMEQIVITMGESSIQDGELVCVKEDGSRELFHIVDGKQADILAARSISAQDEGQADQKGQLVINLGGQIAVKRVEFKITNTKNKKLVEISRVEFLNDMEKRIPEPVMDIPTGVSAEKGDKSFTLKWDRVVNVTGYEVEITYNGQTEVVRAASESLEVKSFQGDKLINKETYKVRVRSVNGTWASKYSEEKAVTPEPSKVPDPPDNLKAVGGCGVIRMSWKNMQDTDTYNVYYREAGEGSFTRVEGVAQNKYEITGLKEKTRYEVYVTGVNSLGESGASVISEAVTTVPVPVKMPNYKLINESNGQGKVSAHILDVTHGRGSMVSSPLDTEDKSALGTVDKDFGSSYQIQDWDDGASYVSPDKGLLFTLDDYYEMSYITFAETEDIASYGKVSVYYYDKDHPDGAYSENPVVLQRTDPNGRKFYLIKLAKPVKANKVRLGFGRSYNLPNIVIAEVNFYYYDSLEDDILALYENDLQTSLKEGVTEETIAELQKRLDTVDAKSGEYHPERAVLQRELDNAKGLLEQGFNDVIEIKTQITSLKDRHLGFGGLNAWQPLGVTAYEGEQLVIYVGHNQLSTGSNSALKLIATQYHAEAGAFASEVASLKVGRNEITIPAIQSLACEGGGALYIQYTGNNSSDRYAVRVNGGVREPVLDLYGVTDKAERAELVTTYMKELEEHVASQEALHKEKHETAGENNKVNREYDKQNCILGATEIVLDRMMLSVSAEQILAGSGKGSLEEKAEKLNQSLYAMDEMMELFYHHKGLSGDPSAPETDRMPAQHLNIRYMRMFAGAFMYASGNHIGIEWGSVPGLAAAVPVRSENGKYVSGNYFGWGIAHEIGHNINQGSYAIAEVTNNYFSVLAQAKDQNDSVRFKYEDVYQKVTSNTVGKPANVFTHLAMYWQLHLAYDRGYNYKIYDSYKEQHDNLFYARVDSYSRNTALAPGNLKLDGGSDQNIMRLACAAAGKDLTEFFVRWGLLPDDETRNYAGQFPVEERALYYLTDEARVYEIEKGGTEGTIKGTDVISPGSSVQASGDIPNEVNLTVQCRDGVNREAILGYEIARYCYEDGEPVRKVIGFTTENTYQDHVAVVNNRVMAYEVIAVDKFGYRSNAAMIGEVKISHDGSHDKSQWTVTTNMYSEDDKAEEAVEGDPCAPREIPAVSRIIDNDYKNTYTGTAQSGDATVLLRLNQVLPVCGLKYTVNSGTPIGNYEIQISTDGSTWTTVKAGSFEEKGKERTVYFENADKDPWVCTYDAAYVRLKAIGQSQVSISEIDLLGPAGDDISFGAEEESLKGAVGILQENYVYEQKEGAEKFIPKGSLIFTGSYKGNPAYNVVVLYDENGAVVGGVDESNVLRAEQIILANVPENGLLGEVSRGTWIYWIEPGADGQLPEISGKVRAQLYRVDNAMTNEGQRLVSDTLPLEMPGMENLDKITLKKETQTP